MDHGAAGQSRTHDDVLLRTREAMGNALSQASRAYQERLAEAQRWVEAAGLRWGELPGREQENVKKAALLQVRREVLRMPGGQEAWSVFRNEQSRVERSERSREANGRLAHADTERLWDGDEVTLERLAAKAGRRLRRLGKG
jgi:hypothetical protein